MYARLARGSSYVACLLLASFLASGCGSAENGRAPSSGAAGGGFAGFQFGTGGFFGTGGVIIGGGIGGVASGAGFIGAGGIIAAGGTPSTGGVPQGAGGGGVPQGTGGAVDPGPVPTGQILDCRGTGPCRIDDGDACCIGATTDSTGNVVSISENCIPPNASCSYPLSIARCDGPEDCRNTDVCCGTLKPFGTVQLFGELKCEPATDCPGSGKFVVCRPGVTQCPGGTTCGSFPTLPADIMVCR